MPKLNLHIPSKRESSGSVELNEVLLRQWIKRLPSNDIEAYMAAYISALKRFNRNEVALQQRFRPDRL